MTQRHTVSFYLNGQLRTEAPASPTHTVLQYLRDQAGLVGTKEGCAEGDCGACTITEASLENGQVVFRAVNACIRFLPTLDGKAIWTVEGLAAEGEPLHPVQQAMVDYHGSQCGFCTPGFIMSMYTMYRKHQVRPSREEVLDNLSGNLCRCTGYRPIIDAAMNMGDYPEAEEALDTLKQQLTQLQAQAGTPLVIETADQIYWAPTTSAQLAQLFIEHPEATLLAGGTDVGLMVTKQLKHFPEVIYLGNVADAAAITEEDNHLVMGAAVLLNEGYEALARQYPEATELWKRFASMPIRNSGTLVGNVANGSPIGDSAPLLIALRTRVVLRKADRRREMALEDLYLDYRKQDREPGEYLESIKVPMRDAALKVATYRLSKRIDQDISAVCSAYAVELDGDRVVSARIAHGGMAATSRRAYEAEKALVGQPWNEETIAAAMAALGRDYQPMSDMRASSDYRLQTARNLLYRFFLETSGETATRISMEVV
ncbi:MAG TPA: xanthine dehydrogenase small subunit [Pusillimonas sp.]|nr:xanthine dehydrogenase small subunit [Pusillimonas sp.]